MIAVTAALIGFFAFVIMRVTTPQMTTLFTDLSVEDSSGIIKDLERQGIQYELRNEGSVIMVPKDKVTRLRMKLAEGGLPKGGGVEPQQIRAIRHLVASAVNGLKPQRVSIVDEAGSLLADGAATDPEQAVGEERRTAYEKRMRKQVEDIVSSVVGSGRARVQLSADFDFNKITQTSDKFD